ncbi:MAG: alpha/beta hydrolase [Chloroflexi bacterium]|nr:alpha/beta hydrolase [Chloroflexota bacterium]
MLTFDDWYAAVPAEQRERLRAFRASHAPKTLTVGGAAWDYLVGGAPDARQTILLLVGGLRVADAGFRALLELESDFRVIAPSYARVATMTEICAGLAAILDAEGVDRAHVLGGSFGGMVAQAFARAHSARLRSLLLSNTAVLDAAAAARYRSELQLLTPVPDDVIRAGAPERFYQMVAPDESESAFWKAYLAELFGARLNKEDVLSTYRCLLDWAENMTLAPLDWPHVLIIESADDATFAPAQRAAVKALYPRAHVYTFAQAGHSAATTQRATYFRLVREFIAQL